MKTSAPAFRLSTEELDAMHRIADSAYLQGKYAEAARYFWFMWLHAPTDARYLKGIGASLFMTRSFGPASTAYACLLQIAPADPEASCMYGYSLLMLGERAQAKEFLQYSLRLSPDGADIHVRARALLDLINR